jgi:hypothetical protein
MQGYADRPFVKAPNWHGLVVFDILFNNLAAGLYLAAALGDLAAPAVFGAVARASYPVALALLVADLVCLTLDLGDPLRFHHMLRVFKPGSPMSLGTWSLVAFSLPVGVLAAMTILGFGPSWHGVRRVIAALGLAPAMAAAMYKGVLFSTTAQAGWRDARWLGGYLATSAVFLGGAELLLLAAGMQQAPATAALRSATLGLAIVNGLLLALVAKDVPSLRKAALVAGVIGIAAPWPLLWLSGTSFFAVAAVAILAGAWIIRRALVHLPHRQKATHDKFA